MTAANTVVVTPPAAPSRAPDTRASDAGSLRFDRRRWARCPADDEVTAVYTDGRERVGVTSLRLRDRSVSGLGVWTPSRLEPGMSVTIQSAAGGLGWSRAQVVRSTPAADDTGGWYVGMRLEQPQPMRAA